MNENIFTVVLVLHYPDFRYLAIPLLSFVIWGFFFTDPSPAKAAIFTRSHGDAIALYVRLYARMSQSKPDTLWPNA